MSEVRRVVAGWMALGLLGCGVVGSSRPHRMQLEERLAAAGFQRYPADTSEKLARLQGLRPLEMTMVERAGKTYYVVTDPQGCHCVWVGGATAAKLLEQIELDQEVSDSERAIARADLVAVAGDAPGDPFDPFDPAFFGAGIPDAVP